MSISAKWEYYCIEETGFYFVFLCLSLLFFLCVYSLVHCSILELNIAFLSPIFLMSSYLFIIFSINIVIKREALQSKLHVITQASIYNVQVKPLKTMDYISLHYVHMIELYANTLHFFLIPSTLCMAKTNK